jgi:hypothetical protein
MTCLAPVESNRNEVDFHDKKNSLEKQPDRFLPEVRGVTRQGMLSETVCHPVTPGSFSGALAQLLLMTLFPQPLLALVRRHLVALALFAAGHAASFLRLPGK